MPDLHPLILPKIHRVLILFFLVVSIGDKHDIICSDSEEITLTLWEDLLRICSNEFPSRFLKVGTEVIPLVFMLDGLLLLQGIMLEVVVDVLVVILFFFFLRGGISDFLLSLLSAHLGLGHSILSQGATCTLYNLDLISEFDPIVTALDPRGLRLRYIDIIGTCAPINTEFLHKHGFLYVRYHIGRLNKRKGE